MSNARRVKVACAGCGLVLALLTASAQGAGTDDPLSRSLQASGENLAREAQTQQQIDRLSDESRAMLDEYQRLHRELDALNVYNQQLQRLVRSQEEEQASLVRQMDDIELTHREIVPLMLHMVGWLQRLLELDSPFLPDERELRLEHLQALMDRADVSIGEKFRRVLEAYQIEMEYGRTIEAYRGELATASGSRTVEFLRIGRVGLYYQTLDRRESGYWDIASESWQPLSERYNRPVRQGLRIALKQTAPDLLRIPVPAPRELQP